MKKLLCSAIAAAMLLAGTPAVLAEDNTTELTLSEGSHLKLDPDSKYIDGIDGTITVGELKANFAGNVDIAGKADDAAVATDDVIGGYKALIYGDVNRDGKITLSDVAGVLQSVAGWTADVNTDAADVDKTGKLNLADVTKILKHIAGWDDISLGNVRMVFENVPVDVETQTDGIEVFFTSMMNKIGANETAHTGEYAYRMKLAKNETESCQAMLYSETAREGLTAELTDFVYEYGDAVLESKLEWVFYNPSAHLLTEVEYWVFNQNDYIVDDFPEVIMPMADTFEMKADRLQHFVISVTSGKDTPAGMYKAQLNFRDADGKLIESANVYAYVWDFTLPDQPYSDSLFNTGGYLDQNGYYWYPDNYEFMLQQNLSSYILPVEISSDEADAYLDDPRVTAFVVDGCDDKYGGFMNNTDEEVVAAWEKLKTNPEWMEKHVFYFTDEPGAAEFQKVVATYEYNVQLLGTTEFRNMTQAMPYYVNDEDRAKNIDSIVRFDPYINVWCTGSHAFHSIEDGGLWGERYAERKYGPWEKRAQEFREKGETIWWYVLSGPEIMYPNFFTYYQGCINRMLMWQQYSKNVEALLYYSTCEGWSGISKYQFSIGGGDGTLTYPGEFWGRTGPCASWRLYQIRDGFDDFDYMCIAEEYVGREEVLKTVNALTPTMVDYSEDYRDLEASREVIAEIILANQK
ncbi:MAG: DUF4091 domain-containing protein [Clostridia bacterium]|nr:DUF4091 domain-containing protein [Clostridia bacterium]